MTRFLCSHGEIRLLVGGETIAKRPCSSNMRRNPDGYRVELIELRR
jgi:hypothetical protein